MTHPAPPAAVLGFPAAPPAGATRCPVASHILYDNIILAALYDETAEKVAVRETTMTKQTGWACVPDIAAIPTTMRTLILNEHTINRIHHRYDVVWTNTKQHGQARVVIEGYCQEGDLRAEGTSNDAAVATLLTLVTTRCSPAEYTPFGREVSYSVWYRPSRSYNRTSQLLTIARRDNEHSATSRHYDSRHGILLSEPETAKAEFTTVDTPPLQKIAHTPY